MEKYETFLYKNFYDIEEMERLDNIINKGIRDENVKLYHRHYPVKKLKKNRYKKISKK